MINKDTKKLIQISLKISEYERLIEIKSQLSNKLKIDLSKSEIIAFLINNYDTEESNGQKPTNKAKKNGINYQAEINLLKDKSQMSFTELSKMLDIPISTLKKYAYGQQTPSKANEQKLLNAFKRYGIR